MLGALILQVMDKNEADSIKVESLVELLINQMVILFSFFSGDDFID